METPGSLPISLKYMSETAKLQKEQSWQEVASRFARVVDGVGCSIDDGILETVIALNVLGITTLASCEGHLDHGLAAPWIDVGNPQAKPLARSAYQKLNAVQQVPQSERQARREEAEEARLLAKRLHWVEHQKVSHYLDLFYGQHHAPLEARLILSHAEWSGIARLESHGASVQDVLAEDERAAKLLEYRQEMDAFADFLKSVYFD